MTCNRINSDLDAYLDDDLDSATVQALQQHLQGCDNCEQLVARELKIREALKEYGDSSMPTPTAEFFDQALLTAATRGQKRQNKRSWLTGFGSAVAAGLAIWVVSTAVITTPVDDPIIDGIPAVTMALEEPHTVNLVFSSASDLVDATLTVELPDGIQVAGLEGRQQITWQTSLQAGRNILPLKLIGTMPTSGELLATLRHGEDDRVFRLRVDVS